MKREMSLAESLEEDIRKALEGSDALLGDTYVEELKRIFILRTLSELGKVYNENFMYKSLYGEIVVPEGGKPVADLFVEYSKLEPTRKQFAEYLEEYWKNK